MSVLLMGVGHVHAAIHNAPSEERRAWRVPSRKAALPNPLGATVELLAKGKAVYAQECATCHGSSGRGDGPGASQVPGGVPPFTNIPGQSDGALFYKISSGRDPMPGYRHSLLDDERWQTVIYLRQLAPPPLATPRHDASVEQRAVLEKSFEFYLALAEALATEDIAAARTAGITLANLLNGSAPEGPANEDWSSLTSQVAASARALTNESPIEEMRTSFKDLSRNLQAWIEAFGHGSKTPYLVLQTTIKRKDVRWIARTSEASNPFGRKASAARCVMKLAGTRATESPSASGVGQ